MSVSNLAITMGQELGGTFLPDDHGIDPEVLASLEFLPEVQEEEERLKEPRRFIPIEEVPDVQHSWHPHFPKLKGSLKDGIRQFIAEFGPKAAVRMYWKAAVERREDILSCLSTAIKDLVAADQNILVRWQSDRSCKTFLQYHSRRGCHIVQAILDALQPEPAA